MTVTTTESPTPRTFYRLEAIPALVRDGDLNISAVAERVYGRPFNAAWSGIRDGVGGRTEHALYEFGDQNTYRRALRAADSTRILLGHSNDWERKPVYHVGHTAIDYWLSTSWPGLGDTTDADVSDFDPFLDDGPHDFYGVVFHSERSAAIDTAPPMRQVLADLIRRREIPRGDYLFQIGDRDI